MVKTPYGYEQLLPEVRTVAIERTLASDLLTLGRQTGAMVAGQALGERLSYAAAVPNGLAANNSYNANDQFAYSGNVSGLLYRIGGLELRAGGSLFSTRDSGASFAGVRVGEAVDAELHWGAAELSGEWLRTHFDPDVGGEHDARGWSVIGSGYLSPAKWQVFARYETYDPDSSIGGDRTTVRTVGVNYFVRGDDLKLSLNYLMGSPPHASGEHDRLIAWLQVLY